MVRPTWALLIPFAILAGCSSPGPTPAEWAQREIVAAELDAAGKAGVRRDTEAAMVALRAGRTDDARDHAEAALRRNPGAARARAILGVALGAAADRQSPPDLALSERAEGELRLARRSAPDDPEVRLLQARFLEAGSRLNLAAKALDGILEGDPDHLDALRAASRVHFELGEERAALPLLARLLRHVPNHPKALFRLAHCRLRLAEAAARGDGDDVAARPAADAPRRAFELAAAAFHDYRARVPGEIEGYLGEAHARFRAAELLPEDHDEQRRTEFAAVRKLLDEAATVDGESPAPDHDRGVLLQRLGQLEAARAAYERALGRDPLHLPSILNMANLLDATGDVRAAAAFCRRALALPVTDAERRRLEDYLQKAAARPPIKSP